MTGQAQQTRIDAEVGSRLESLLAEYAQTKPAADAAAERLKTVTDGIKAELQAAAPGVRSVVVASAALVQPLQLIYVEQWRVDAKRLKAEDPYTYARWARKSGAWQLRRAPS